MPPFRLEEAMSSHVSPDTAERLISPVWPRYTPIVAERAEGAYIYDRDGTRYLDFTCGIGVTLSLIHI